MVEGSTSSNPHLKVKVDVFKDISAEISVEIFLHVTILHTSKSFIYLTSECPRSEDQIFKVVFQFFTQNLFTFVQFEVFLNVHSKVYTIFLSVSMFRMSCHPLLCT